MCPYKIKVKKKDDIIPFSRGILAKSLMATGIDYMKAYRISNEIRKDLYKNNHKLISTKELRACVYSLLEHKYEKEVADNYYIWEMIKKRNVPLVILLGGAPGVDKTKVAMNVANRLNILNSFSTDAIRSIMRKVVSEDLLPELHERSYFAWEALMKLPTSTHDKIIVGFKEHTRHVSIGIKGAIERTFEIKTRSVLYGVHLTPNIVADGFSNNHIFHAICYINNKEHHKKVFFSRFRDMALDHEKFEQIRIIHDHILQSATENSIKTYENSNPEKTSTDIIEDILKFAKKHVS